MRMSGRNCWLKIQPSKNFLNSLIMGGNLNIASVEKFGI